MKTLFGLSLLAATLVADPAPTPAPPVEAPMDQQPPLVEQTVNSDEYGSLIVSEFKMGYFRFDDKNLRHRYEKGLLDMQLTSSFCFWKPLYAYVGIEYIGDDGRVPKTHIKTKIRLVPISAGVQYLQPITYDLKYYVTLGARYFFAHQWTPSASLTRNGLGGFANTGFMYYLSPNIVIDFFGEYSYKKMHFKGMGGNLQVGGMTLGAGIGYFW